MCFFDVTTLQVCIGTFQDDENLSTFRTLVSQIQPVEVIYEREMSGSEAVRMLRYSPAEPVMSPL